MSAREASPAPDYIARAEALAPLIQELAPAIERERRLPQKLVDQMIDAGLFRMLLPRDYDGGETDPMTFVQVLEAIARHDASTAWCLGQTGVCATASAFLPADSARAIWGDRRARRLARHRLLELRQRRPSCELDRRPLHRLRCRRHAAPQRHRRHRAA